MQNSTNQPSSSASATSTTPPPSPANGNGVHTTGNGHSANGNGNGALPTGIYSALDSVRQGGGATSPAPAKSLPNGAGKTTDYSSVETDVPLESGVLPRLRSLRLQIRFMRGIVFAGWLFVRLVFWQIYVRRYFPRYVDRTNQRRWTKYAREFRGFAISMGGVFIKLGQFISTRVDALPEAIVRELESLQDEVPTVKFRHIRRAVEGELGAIESRFAWFNEEPIAAASLGQAHRAKLLNGERVVVKVQRPGIREICYTDLHTVRIVARIAGRFAFISRRADPVALGSEFGQVLLEELSYNHEARNARRFYTMFRDDLGVYIPAIHGEHSTDRVLTMEDVTSIKLNDYAALEAAGVSRKAVAKRLMDTYLSQIFDHFFFHADPHPGNLFVYPLPVTPEEERAYIGQGGGRPFYLIFVDFGMTGTLTREIADGMVSTLAAVLSRDPEKLVNGYARLGFILPNADMPRIKDAVRAAFDEVWGMSMTEIRDMDYERAANIANEFSDLIKSMPFYIPQDFIYLGRTISILSGMTTSLDPAFNPWQEMEPYARKLVARGFGLDVDVKNGEISGSFLQNLLNGNGAQALIGVIQEVNRRTAPINPVQQMLEEIRSGELRVVSEPGYTYKAQLRRLEATNRATSRAVIFGSVLIASTLLYTSGDVTLAAAGYGFCGLSALWGFLRG